MENSYYLVTDRFNNPMQWLHQADFNPFGVTKVITDPNLPARPFHQPITTLSVADGFWVLLSSLQPGPHTIKFGGVYDFNQPQNPPDLGFVFRTEVTYNLSVQ